MKYDLSILIPARNEVYLKNTVIDLLKNIRGNTQIIVGLDGEWSNPPLPQHERLTVVYFPVALGQRACTNQLCRVSTAKYVMKVDAHCAFDGGFDVKMMEEMRDDYTMMPLLKHLHVFDWRCKKCGSQWDQGRSPDRCYLRSGKDGKGRKPNNNCDNVSDFEKIGVWEVRPSPTNVTYTFDRTLHFQYWRKLAERPEIKAQGDVIETMSIQGSCFMLTRKKYWELNICDEAHGSWGQQGTEVACKTWLSGGKLVVNKKTWYAHLFRTQGGDFGFPYPNPGNEQERAKQYSRDFWFSNLEDLKKKWPPAKYDLKWLINKFAPVPDWKDAEGKNV